jgi:hypothetical protein
MTFRLKRANTVTLACYSGIYIVRGSETSNKISFEEPLSSTCHQSAEFSTSGWGWTVDGGDDLFLGADMMTIY